MYTSLQFSDSAVPTGINPSAVAILLFRIIIPYPLKLSLIAGMISASAGVATLFLGKYLLAMPLLPELLLVPYIVEHYMMAAIGVVLAKALR